METLDKQNENEFSSVAAPRISTAAASNAVVTRISPPPPPFKLHHPVPRYAVPLPLPAAAPATVGTGHMPPSIPALYSASIENPWIESKLKEMEAEVEAETNNATKSLLDENSPDGSDAAVTEDSRGDVKATDTDLISEETSIDKEAPSLAEKAAMATAPTVSSETPPLPTTASPPAVTTTVQKQENLSPMLALQKTFGPNTDLISPIIGIKSKPQALSHKSAAAGPMPPPHMSAAMRGQYQAAAGRQGRIEQMVVRDEAMRAWNKDVVNAASDNNITPPITAGFQPPPPPRFVPPAAAGGALGNFGFRFGGAQPTVSMYTPPSNTFNTGQNMHNTSFTFPSHAPPPVFPPRPGDAHPAHPRSSVRQGPPPPPAPSTASLPNPTVARGGNGGGATDTARPKGQPAHPSYEYPVPPVSQDPRLSHPGPSKAAPLPQPPSPVQNSQRRQRGWPEARGLSADAAALHPHQQLTSHAPQAIYNNSGGGQNSHYSRNGSGQVGYPQPPQVGHKPGFLAPPPPGPLYSRTSRSPGRTASSSASRSPGAFPQQHFPPQSSEIVPPLAPATGGLQQAAGLQGNGSFIPQQRGMDGQPPESQAERPM